MFTSCFKKQHNFGKMESQPPKYILDRNSLSSFDLRSHLAAILRKYNNHSLRPFSFIDDNLPKAFQNKSNIFPLLWTSGHVKCVEWYIRSIKFETDLPISNKHSVPLIQSDMKKNYTLIFLSSSICTKSSLLLHNLKKRTCNIIWDDCPMMSIIFFQTWF